MVSTNSTITSMNLQESHSVLVTSDYAHADFLGLDEEFTQQTPEHTSNRYILDYVKIVTVVNVRLHGF
ncbi:hypothetical protein E5288_WYG019277 [Bos mutus]|uniref:Uncharacterized protein n=1 Tax=Bos mutus TaxID=72004 RepID=A0A6B0S2F8_9CETA|nr:hypothetical protein [Bos mutus]